ncbi:MAG: hypothetical protein ABW022_14810 [Actinoplanes sp.]
MTDALTNLTNRWGLGNAEIARALHTNGNVIRHWRNGVEPNSDEVARADLLDNFLTEVHDLGIAEPGAWMSTPLADGYQVTRWVLYIAGCSHELLRRNASGELSRMDLLHEFNPDWRRAYWTSFKTVEAEDGNTSIVGKTYDDVRAQIA